MAGRPLETGLRCGFDGPRRPPSHHEHKPVQPTRCRQPRTEAGERASAFAAERRRAVGRTSRFNPHDVANRGQRGASVPVRSPPSVAVRSAEQAGSTGLSRLRPRGSELVEERQIPPRGSGSGCCRSDLLGVERASRFTARCRQPRTKGGERACAFAAERRRAVGRTSRFNPHDVANRVIFSPPRGGDVREADRGGRACLCGRRQALKPAHDFNRARRAGRRPPPSAQTSARLQKSEAGWAPPPAERSNYSTPCSASQRSASIAARQPMPAAVIAWR